MGEYMEGFEAGVGAAGGGSGVGEVITMASIYYRLIELEERVYQLEHPEEFVGKTKRGRGTRL